MSEETVKRPDPRPADLNREREAQLEKALEHRRRLREQQRQRRQRRLPGTHSSQQDPEPAGL